MSSDSDLGGAIHMCFWLYAIKSPLFVLLYLGWMEDPERESSQKVPGWEKSGDWAEGETGGA